MTPQIEKAKQAIEEAFTAFLNDDWPWMNQVSEDDFKPYQPTEEQLKAEREEFIKAFIL